MLFSPDAFLRSPIYICPMSEVMVNHRMRRRTLRRRVVKIDEENEG
jgi:hypothetical protein